MNKVLSSMLIALTLSFGLVACGGEEEAESSEQSSAETPTADSPPAEEEEEAEEESGGGGGDACERARDCCAAYVEAVGGSVPGISAETTCASVANLNGPGATATCEAAIQGWRTATEANPAVDTLASCE